MAIYYTDNEGNKVKVASNGNSLPIGTIFPATCKLDDACFHLADGSLISQTGIYSQFVTWLKARINENNANVPTCTQSEFDSDVATYGQCGKYVIDDTAGTIRLPKITKFIQGLSNVSEIANNISAGLPNITGSIGDIRYKKGSVDSNGALYNVLNNGVSPAGYTNDTDAPNGGILSFDASRSNSIYGNSTTVQPPAIQYPYYIVMGSNTKTPTQVNLDNIVEDLNNKADKDLSNVTRMDWNIINSTSTSVIIPMAWDTVREFYFRVLGGDSATFGYLYIPKEFWHNNGTYVALLNCIDQTFKLQGSALFSISNKTSNSFQINMTVKGTQNNFMVGYR